MWNELPVDTDFSSIESFKRALDGFNFNAYCDNLYLFLLCFASFYVLSWHCVIPATANEPMIDVLFYFLTF